MCKMCDKIGRRKHKGIGMMSKEEMTDAFVDGIINVLAAGGGAVAAQELGVVATAPLANMLPASMQPYAGDIIDGIKVAGGIAVIMFVKGESAKYLRPIAVGIAAQGALNLANSFGLAGPQYVRIGGPDNRMYALAGNRRGPTFVAGPDNRMYALAGKNPKMGASVPAGASTFRMNGL